MSNSIVVVLYTESCDALVIRRHVRIIISVRFSAPRCDHIHMHVYVSMYDNRTCITKYCCNAVGYSSTKVGVEMT